MTEIIILVGLPGAGKSTLISDLGSNIEIVDGDSLKTSEAVVAKVKSFKSCERSIIVDATNVTLERRRPLIALAKEWEIPVKCVWLNTDVKTCVKRSKERHANGGKNIPPVAIYKLNKNFVEPTLEEGFEEVVKCQ